MHKTLHLLYPILSLGVRSRPLTLHGEYAPVLPLRSRSPASTLVTSEILDPHTDSRAEPVGCGAQVEARGPRRWGLTIFGGPVPAADCLCGRGQVLLDGLDAAALLVTLDEGQAFKYQSQRHNQNQGSWDCRAHLDHPSPTIARHARYAPPRAKR